jgi:hypothetical protein
MMNDSNVRAYRKWILVFDHETIYFLNKRTAYLQTAVQFDSKIFDVQIDRVTNIDIFVRTKSGVFKLKILQDKRGYIPEGILIMPNMISIFEMKT